MDKLDLSKLSSEYVVLRRPNRAPLDTEEKVADGRGEDRDSVLRRRGSITTDDSNRAPVNQAEVRNLVVHRAMSSSKATRKPMQAWLSYYLRDSGAVNTAFASNSFIQPNFDASWASWQAVFDEVKVLSAEIYWQVWFSTLPTAFATQTPNAIVVYEPSDGPGVSSINQGMQYEHFQLLNVGSNSNGTYATAPQSTAKGGHMVFKVKMPKGTLVSATDPLLSTGEWRPTQDANNYYWGIFCSYVAAGGATSVLQMERFVRMRCEFRVRR